MNNNDDNDLLSLIKNESVSSSLSSTPVDDDYLIVALQ
jgi:hypothetical protein